MGSAGSSHVDVFQRIGVPLKPRLDFQHHMILVQLREDRRYETLSECVVQSVVDHLRRNSKTRGAVSIDHQSCLESLGLLVAGDIAQFGQRLQLFNQPRRPGIQLVRICIFETVLKLGTADPIVNCESLYRLHKQRDAFDSFQFRLQAPDDLGGASLPLIVRLQVDLHAPAVDCGVRSIDSDERREAFHIRVLQDDLGQFLLSSRHRRKRNILRGFGHTEDQARVLHGKEALRHVDVKPYRRGQCPKRNELSQKLMTQDPSQRPAICGDDPLKAAAGDVVKPAPFGFGPVPQELRAHHRRQRERDDSRYQNSEAQRNGELTEQPSDDVAHE